MNDTDDIPRAFPLIYPPLRCLEQLISRSKVDLQQTHSPWGDPAEGGHSWTVSAPLPAMLQLIKSSPSLKHLYLDFRYSIRGCNLQGCKCMANNLPHADHIWFLLLSLTTECLLPSIKIYVFVRSDVRGGCACPPDFANCRHLMQFVEKGIVVIKPRAAGYEVQCYI